MNLYDEAGSYRHHQRVRRELAPGPNVWRHHQDHQHQLQGMHGSQEPQAEAAATAAAAYSSLTNWLMTAGTSSWQQHHMQLDRQPAGEFHHSQHHSGTPPDVDLREPDDLLAGEEAKWRQLPPSLRRRAGAQAATSLLKAWMRAHADNPYPSKREKSALASLTNMSFAQISTWFANARRRLKKDSATATMTAAVCSTSGATSSSTDESAHVATTASASAAIGGKPRIWSLVETALDTRDHSSALVDHGKANHLPKPVFNPVVTPEELCCWQMCQHYANMMQS